MNISQGVSTITGYRVEIRDALFCTSNPAVITNGITNRDVIVGPEWQTVHFQQGGNPAGVPAHRASLYGTDTHGLLSLDSATALAWTLIAQNELRLGLECRLVQFKLETKHSLEKEGVVAMPPIKSRVLEVTETTPE